MKGLSIMKHIRRTRHLMMPIYRSYFAFCIFHLQVILQNIDKKPGADYRVPYYISWAC
ncbi:MAG: leader peptide SpeFL [Plesiomonas sp.]